MDEERRREMRKAVADINAAMREGGHRLAFTRPPETGAAGVVDVAALRWSVEDVEAFLPQFMTALRAMPEFVRYIAQLEGDLADERARAERLADENARLRKRIGRIRDVMGGGPMGEMLDATLAGDAP